MSLMKKLDVLVLSLVAGAVPSFAADLDVTRVPEVKPIINRQNQIGSGVTKSVGEIRDLIDDASQNPDVEMPGKEQLNDAPPVLDDISRNHVPKVIDGIRKAHEPGGAKTGLLEGSDESDAILSDFTKLLSAVKSSLAPAETERIIETAIQKQKEATEKAKEAREKNETLEGKPREKLTEDEKATLRGLLNKQKEATTALTNVLQHLNENPGMIDPNALTGVENKSKETHTDISENKLRTAERKGDEIVSVLEGARDALNPKSGKSELESKLAGLNGIKEKQEGVQHDTKTLDPKNSDRVGETAQVQGEISKALGELGKNDPELGKAAEQSRHAADDIASGKHGDASKTQQGILDTLNEAISKTQGELAAQKPGENSKNSRQSKAQNKPQQKGKGVEEQTQVVQNAMGSFEYGTPGAGHAEGWNVALQAKDRADVEQAVAEKMPAKYALQIKLYYVNLQGAKAGN